MNFDFLMKFFKYNYFINIYTVDSIVWYHYQTSFRPFSITLFYVIISFFEIRMHCIIKPFQIISFAFIVCGYKFFAFSRFYLLSLTFILVAYSRTLTSGLLDWICCTLGTIVSFGSIISLNWRRHRNSHERTWSFSCISRSLTMFTSLSTKTIPWRRCQWWLSSWKWG